jgi:hypothetical protein
MKKTLPSNVNNSTFTILSRKNNFLIIGSIIILCTATIVLFSDKITPSAVVLGGKQEDNISVLPPEPTKEEVLTWWCKSWKISKETCNLLSTK